MKTPNFTHVDRIPDGKELSAMRRNSALNEASADIARSLRELAEAIRPDALALFARKRRPNAPAVNTVIASAQELRDLRAEVVALNAALDKLVDEETARLATLVAAAGSRTLQIVEMLRDLNRAIGRCHEADVQREKMQNAGVSNAVIESVIAGLVAKDAERRAALEAEIAALGVESDALDRFLASRDEADLPEGFAAPADGQSA